MTSATIPDSVKSIGDHAFTDTDLKEITYGGQNAERWDQIAIGDGNTLLSPDKAVFHYGDGTSTNDPVPDPMIAVTLLWPSQSKAGEIEIPLLEGTQILCAWYDEQDRMAGISAKDAAEALSFSLTTDAKSVSFFILKDSLPQTDIITMEELSA